LNSSDLFKADNEITLKIIHSPGHSKGSVNIYFIEDKILFTADSIPLKNDIPNYSSYSELIKSLNRIKSAEDYKILLTSWTPSLSDAYEIKNLITEGENYMLKLNEVVLQTYVGQESEPLAFCKKAIAQLGLPPFLANPIVDKAFRSHLE
jgi:glyoxylase-like metal-dependent hydrolase (beta-lactamase superfamily II)